MQDFICSVSRDNLSYNHVEHRLLPLPDLRENFVQASAEFFIQCWMSSVMPQVLDVWQNWEAASEEEKLDYRSRLDHLFSPASVLIDNPAKGVGYTAPMATFAETMLRWLRSCVGATQLLVDPPEPAPPSEGKIDLIEVTGVHGKYDSMKLTMWEVKSSESQANGQQSKIYSQLEAYPRRFYRVANSLAHRYKDHPDPAFLEFLKNMTGMVRNRQPQVQYGVFIMYDTNVQQKGALLPDLHRYPSGHPVSGERCHHLALFLGLTLK